MQLHLSDGRLMFVNDGVTYKNFLEKKIEQYIALSKKNELTMEQENELNELMDLYNQIVDQENEESLNDTVKLR